MEGEEGEKERRRKGGECMYEGERERREGWRDGWMDGRKEGRKEGRKRKGRKEGGRKWAGKQASKQDGRDENIVGDVEVVEGKNTQMFGAEEGD